ERVLAAAVADDEDLHEPWVVWVRCAFGWEEARRGKPGGEGPGAPGLAGRGPGGREGTVGGGLRGRTPVRGGRRRGRHPRKAAARLPVHDRRAAGVRSHLLEPLQHRFPDTAGRVAELLEERAGLLRV